MGLVIIDVPVYTGSTVVVPVPDYIPVYRICTDGSSSSRDEEVGSIDKTLYRILSMQDDMKTVVKPIRARNEFELFLLEASNKTDSLEYNSAFDSLDEYLGNVGVTHGIY